jgi:tetratricopeptide (TPR) repeat protein
MSAQARMRTIVAVVALVAAAVVAGVVFATRQDPAQPKARCKDGVPAGIYPSASTRNVKAVQKALAKGPKGAARTLEALAAEQPNDPVVQFNYGTALFCAGFDAEAAQAYRRAKKTGRDTRYQVVADNVLHPRFFDQGYPLFQYSGHDPLLIQGQVAQRNFHQETAERLWARAAKLHPNDPEAQVAAAVGRFDMDNLSASFSRLGPLATRFPKSQSVRFHLGLLLVWTGQGRDLILKEFRLAYRLGPSTVLGTQAKGFLDRLASGGTKPSKR